MKKTPAKAAKAVEPPVFPQTMHTLRGNTEKPVSKGKASTRHKVESRDTREDRSTRQAKTARANQSNSRGRG